MWALLKDCVAKTKRSVCCQNISKLQHRRTDRTARGGEANKTGIHRMHAGGRNTQGFVLRRSWSSLPSSHQLGPLAAVPSEALSIEAVVLFDGLGHVPGARHSLACEGARGLHSKFSCKRNNSVFLLHWLNWTYLWENSHVSRLDPYRFATIRCDCDLALAERV
jgi:hypothetical protein